jgi:L-asparaginase / beta-aspartyl-peptidase
MTPEKEETYRRALEMALHAGKSVLQQGGSSLDAVCAAVISLEDCPLFNAGRGAVFTHEGTHEMDAAIMDGKTRQAGAVAGVTGVRNPIRLAREIMDHSDHVFLCSRGAEDFARHRGLTFESDDYFRDEFRWNQFQKALKSDQIQLDHSTGDEKKFGTVGAVARDAQGHLAAATSTGGMTNKRWGRIGDSPMIGAGTYASDKTCAISCTGHGEYFIRSVVAYDIACLMEYKGLSLHEACSMVVMDKLAPMGGEGGLIAVDSYGTLALPFNSDGMYRGWADSHTQNQIRIYRDE